MTASRLGIDAQRLRPDWAALLPALGELGRVMVLTRNEHCVHERKGLYREVSVAASGQMGLVVSADIDLRLFLGGWASVFAIAEETALLAPNAQMTFFPWKEDPARVLLALRHLRTFLKANAPA